MKLYEGVDWCPCLDLELTVNVMGTTNKHLEHTAKRELVFYFSITRQNTIIAQTKKLFVRLNVLLYSLPFIERQHSIYYQLAGNMNSPIFRGHKGGLSRWSLPVIWALFFAAGHCLSWPPSGPAPTAGPANAERPLGLHTNTDNKQGGNPLDSTNLWNNWTMFLLSLSSHS